MAATRNIVDMAGRSVMVPAVIRRIYVAHDPPAIFLASVAPEKMLGFTIDRSAAANRFLPPAVRRLPTIGGASRTNPEKLLALDMDVAVVWNIRGSPDAFAEQITEMGKPVVMVDASPFSSYPAAFRLLGRLTGREDRAEPMARALEETAKRLADFVTTLRPQDRVRVYYADAPNGLQSDCITSFRGEDIRLAGGENVVPCTVADSMTVIVSENLEKLLVLDPDVIVARTAAEARFIRHDSGWHAIRAVRQGRVLAFPELPFNWAERPHCQLKILGLQWLAHKLYPGRYPFDLSDAARKFFRLFFDVEVTSDDIALLHA
jgi:iron complex transport system substrate-binding protein